MTYAITTECGHCAQPIQLEFDSQLRYRVLTHGAKPLVFTPQVDFARLSSPSIIDDF